MAEVAQSQWVKEDGQWKQRAINCKPTLPSRPTQSTKAPVLPPRNSRLSNEQTAPRPLIKSADSFRRDSDVSSIHSRRTSEVILSRRPSNESINSTATTETSLSALSNGTSFTSKSDRYTIRAPEYDPAALPALPPRKTKEEKEADARAARYPLKGTKSAASVPRVTEPARPSPPPRPQTRPPPPLPTRGNQPEETPVSAEDAAPAPVRANGRPELPGRQHISNTPQLPTRNDRQAEERAPTLPRRTLPPPPAKRSALSLGFGSAQPQPPERPTNRPGAVAANGTPPPVPLGSRPDLAALQASKPKVNGASPNIPAAVGDCCLECRDFSAPDTHASRFPRESLPSQDLGWLAQQLTTQFPSPTDKARAIFAWLHHNIAYDTVAFFGNNVQPSTPASTLATGLAVCEGYAALFAALALKAGLEAIVVGGHGKGVGYSPTAPGEALPPPDITGHAWNAVKIDGGEWKLIDPCWGAGSVCPKRSEAYQKRFAPTHFTQSNDHFGRSHLPQDPSKQFRNDGRIIDWEEYLLSDKQGTGAMVFQGYASEEGISQFSMKPTSNPIILSEQGPTVRFSFQTVCPHWDGIKTRKDGYYLYILVLAGVEDILKKYVPFKKADGIFWCDIPTRDLGRPGQMASISVVTEFCGKHGRGLTGDHFMSKLRAGTYSMKFGGVAQWAIA